MPPSKDRRVVLTITGGDVSDFQSCERSVVPFSRYSLYSGCAFPVSNDEEAVKNQLVHNGERVSAHTAAGAVSIAPYSVDVKNMWKLSVNQGFTDNMLQEVKTLNIYGKDGKMAAKLFWRVSPSNILDAKLCVRTIGPSIFTYGVPRSFFVNRVHVSRTLFGDVSVEKTQREDSPLLQWCNIGKQRIKSKLVIHDYEEEMIVHIHQTCKPMKEVDSKNSKLVCELRDKSLHISSLETELEKAKQKLIQQSVELKLCHDQVLELKGNIRVFCRCRPLTSDSINEGDTSVIDFNAANNELYVHSHEGVKKVFKFDRVFTPSHSQMDVFLETAPLVVSVLDGFNVCIFAYGQTGTGKTYTMEGSEDNRGVNYRTLEKLFHLASERKGLYTYDISVSVLEVYNEEIRDLLTSSPSGGQNSTKRLEIKQDVDGMHHVPGVVEASVHCIEEVWEVLQTGSRARAVGSTNVNKHSSRSHCMLCVMVKGENLLTGECTKSKLWLIDLAGSERIGKTDVHGERLKEAQSINKSLSALGDVIHALAGKNGHIPYRNSKITHLLQDSLGGQSKTLMFVQISPSEHDKGETLCSLNFASRVRGVELGVARKQIDPADVLKYKKLAEKTKQDGILKDEIMKELQEAYKVKEQACKALSVKLKEKEGLLEVEKKARFMAEEKLREQHSLIEKQKLAIDKLTNELRAKQPGPQEPKAPPAFKMLTPQRPPLQERSTDNRVDKMDNRVDKMETIQRPKKRPAEEYMQKENAYNEPDGKGMPGSRMLPRRASMSAMQHQWSTAPAVTSLPSNMVPKKVVENLAKENAFSRNNDRVASRVIIQKPTSASICQVSPWKPSNGVPTIPEIISKSHQEDRGEEFMSPRIVSRRRGRASLSVLPQRQPSSWAPSPLVKFSERRRTSMMGFVGPCSVETDSRVNHEENMSAAVMAPSDMGHGTTMAQRDTHKALFTSPHAHIPSSQAYTTNSHPESHSSNAVGVEVQGMLKARRVSCINGKPPRHPHPVSNNQAGEEFSHRLSKMRRISTVNSSTLEMPHQVWTLSAITPATPGHRAMPTADGRRMLNTQHLGIASNTLPWEAPQQQGWAQLPTAPATQASMIMSGGAQRVLLTEKRSGVSKQERWNHRERGWNR